MTDGMTSIAVCKNCRSWDKTVPTGSKFGAASTVAWCRLHQCKSWEGGACVAYRPAPHAVKAWKASLEQEGKNDAAGD